MENVETKVEKKPNIVKDFFITTLNGMAFGLFATLIIGTIISTIGGFFPKAEEINSFTSFMYIVLTNTGTVLSCLTGAGIGVGIALALKFDTLKVIVLAAVGEIASYFSLSTKFVTDGVQLWGKFQIGDPLTIYLVVIVTALLLKLILRKKTPVDILIIPLLGVLISIFLSIGIRYPAIFVTYGVQWIVNEATLAVPFLMGIVVAVVMGMALTAPISSAAIAAMVFIGEGEGLAIASGAAVIGCCCQMVGFAIQARKDNSIGMVISIGIGTSMLEFKNILKKPAIWLPTIVASAILGPISTCWLHVVCMGSSAGMGTAGLVGIIGTYASMGNTWQTWVGIFVLELVAPALLVFGLDLLARKLKLYGEGDLKV
ncbi:MAG: PTS sugar transporter subunit IIC [Erysipelotrichaceae bacterium]|nr:PTS sugar transporter subunit IIC [Erysipelotrichaceae bacterium]